MNIIAGNSRSAVGLVLVTAAVVSLMALACEDDSTPSLEGIWQTEYKNFTYFFDLTQRQLDVRGKLTRTSIATGANVSYFVTGENLYPSVELRWGLVGDTVDTIFRGNFLSNDAIEGTQSKGGPLLLTRL